METKPEPARSSIIPEQVELRLAAGAAPGCAVSTISEEVSESLALGRFDGEGGPAVDEHTVYDLASVSKLFTTALMLRLHEAGVLSLEDACSQYLPNFHGSGARLIDLLTHRVDFRVFLSEYRAKHPDGPSLLTALMGIAPPSQASTGVTYGNLGFVYLGQTIEAVTGRDLNANMESMITDLGLQETYTGPSVSRLGIATPPTEVIDGHVVQGITHDETARTLGGLAGNAGIFATAADLAKFGKAWLDGKVVGPELLRAVFSNYDQTGARPQGIGWWMRFPAHDGMRSEENIFSHTGFTGSILVVNPANERVGALTCNRTYYGRENDGQTYIWEMVVDWAKQA